MPSATTKSIAAAIEGQSLVVADVEAQAPDDVEAGRVHRERIDPAALDRDRNLAIGIGEELIERGTDAGQLQAAVQNAGKVLGERCVLDEGVEVDLAEVEGDVARRWCLARIEHRLAADRAGADGRAGAQRRLDGAQRKAPVPDAGVGDGTFELARGPGCRRTRGRDPWRGRRASRSRGRSRG
jgi:hypothetical protein